MDSVAGGKVMLACLSKLPSIGVVLTLVMLAARDWESGFTLAVLGLIAMAFAYKLIKTLWAALIFEPASAKCTGFLGCGMSCFRSRKGEGKKIEQSLPEQIPNSPELCV